MATKKITIEKLAGMIKKSFDSVDKRFDEVDEKMEQLATKKQVNQIAKNIKSKMGEVTSHANKLEGRVEYIENVLNIPAKK